MRGQGGAGPLCRVQGTLPQSRGRTEGNFIILDTAYVRSLYVQRTSRYSFTYFLTVEKYTEHLHFNHFLGQLSGIKEIHTAGHSLPPCNH